MAIVGLLFIPAVEKAYFDVLFKHVAPKTMVSGATPGSVAFALAQILGAAPQIPQYGPTFSEASIRNDRIAGFAKAFDEPGLMIGLSPTGGTILWRTSHKANKEFYADPNAGRVEGDFIGAINYHGACGKMFAPGVMPTVLQRATNDPMWWQTRDLWTATIPALARHPADVPDFIIPPVAGLMDTYCDTVNSFDEDWSGLLKYMDPTKLVPFELGYLVGFNLWRQVFGVDLTKDEMDQLNELLSVVGNAVALGCNDKTSAQAIEFQKNIENKVLTGKWSKEFLAEAKKRGLNGEEKLRELIFSFLGAGYGAPGTAFFAMHLITFIRGNPERVALYQKDPEAFILEVVRLKGAGGANSFYPVTKTTKWTLGNGIEVLEEKGTTGVTNLLAAGWDPNVWGGPSKDPAHAEKFLPGRENRESVLCWMSELRDIRKCPNMTGCAAAPRFCPGSELTQRLTRQATDFYIKTCKPGAAKVRDEI